MKNHIPTVTAIALGLFFCGHCGIAAPCTEYTTETDGIRCYTARTGDTFAMLSKRCGYDADLLAAMNNLSCGYCCRGGETLKLPLDDTPNRTVYASRSINLRGKLTATWQAPLCGIITSVFSANRSGSPHHGIDIAADSGSNILAAHSGTVIQAGWQNNVYGYAVLIDHGNGWQTHYAHCSKVLVKAGESVKQGQKIALVGSTGNSTGPHLHLEITKDGVFLNPALYFADLAV